MGKTKEEKVTLRREFKQKIITLIVSAFGFVAALAWNDAILFVFKTYLPETGQLYPKFTYAVIVTFIAVLVTFWLSKLIDS